MRASRQLLVLSTLLTANALAFAGADPPAKKSFGVDEIWAVSRVGTPVLSRDGKRVAYTIATYDLEENRSNADVWLLELSGGAPRRLTANKASDTSPAFSPDGRRLAFLSKRDGDAATELYVLPVDGGEPERVTDMPTSVASPKWFPDGKKIAFLASVVAGAESPEDTKKALEKREKNKVKARVTENRLYRYWDHWLTDEDFTHLFVVDLATKKVTDLTPGSRRHFSLDEGGTFDIAPDGQSLVFSANSVSEPYPALNWDLFLVPAAGGEARNLTPSRSVNDTNPVFSPDGKSIVFGTHGKADGWPDYTRLALLDVSSGKVTLLTDGWENGTGGWTFTKDGKALVFTAEVRARTGVYTVSTAAAAGGAPREEPKEIWKGGSASGPVVTAGGEVVFQRSDLNHPPELVSVKLDGSGFRALTSVNDALVATWDLGAVKEMTFQGAGGDDVQMFVVYPPGFGAAKKYPLVQLVHGGPVGTFGDSFSFRWNPHAFAAPGYVVAMVNFHGSSSFGQKWVESILGAHPDKPFTDVMKATDFLVAQGSVDETRMAAAGGSYGGFLVNWIAGHTDRFKCLVSHAGVYDLMAQFASDATYGRHHSYGGTPFQDRDNVEKWSPNRYAANFRTPVLILHGERDYRVPAGQGLEFYGTLTAKGVPARLVYYPDENHWILKGQNAKHWYGEVHGWLARWLKQK
ncbi:MAG: S9 family peptidase [Thermoanaerobaculia bacterium]|nr:S9 family peptidase [Thermoanaerobaculia bacterium]